MDSSIIQVKRRNGRTVVVETKSGVRLEITEHGQVVEVENVSADEQTTYGRHDKRNSIGLSNTSQIFDWQTWHSFSPMETVRKIYAKSITALAK